jgi:glycosyltransferase involved in cell wall biosynthesis
MELSLIIPTFNRPESLIRCLNSLTQLQCEGDFEVVVVDDGGNSDLSEAVDSFSPSP